MEMTLLSLKYVHTIMIKFKDTEEQSQTHRSVHVHTVCLYKNKGLVELQCIKGTQMVEPFTISKQVLLNDHLRTDLQCHTISKVDD